MQDDLLMATQTPTEILEFSAKLRLPSDLTLEEKKYRVQEVIENLNLGSCKDTRVGAPGESRGISGGERKRVSVTHPINDSPRSDRSGTFDKPKLALLRRTYIWIGCLYSGNHY
jgi:ABC-type multidrug transport system ATPase subunit